MLFENKKNRLSLISLSLAAGIIYVLPYIRQSYHGTMIAVLGVSNTELGILSSIFGVFAVLCYVPGGWLADRVSPHKLLAFSLAVTGGAGLYFATLPSYQEVILIHAIWGVSTILTFWAAFIKANRETGSAEDQAQVFGLVEGGRGIVEAVLGAFAVFIFTSFASNHLGFQYVILMYSVLCLVISVLVWFMVPRDDEIAKEVSAEKPKSVDLFKEVLRYRTVWLLAIIVLCAYSAFWGTYSLAYFATDGFGQSEAYGATLSNFRMWLRPLAAIIAGFVASKTTTRAFLLAAFGMLAVAFLVLSTLPTTNNLLMVLWVDTAAISVCVYALRGVYFSLLEEASIPLYLTGTAAGIISVIGYTPDIYFPLVSGWLYDTYPGILGHRYLFSGLVFASVIGFLATWYIPKEKTQQV